MSVLHNSLIFPLCRTTVANLNQKLDGIRASSLLANEELAVAKINIEQLQQENLILKSENSQLSDVHQRQIQVSFSLLLLFVELISLNRNNNNRLDASLSEI